MADGQDWYDFGVIDAATGQPILVPRIRASDIGYQPAGSSGDQTTQEQYGIAGGQYGAFGEGNYGAWNQLGNASSNFQMGGYTPDAKGFDVRIKSADKEGSGVRYERQGDYFVPVEYTGKTQWNTNPTWRDYVPLALIGGFAAAGLSGLGAAAGASGASGMAAGEGAMAGAGLSSADLMGGAAAAGSAAGGGAAAPAAATGGSWGLVDTGALGAASGGASAAGTGIVDKALSFLNTPLGNTVLSGALKLAGGALTPNETAMRLNAEEKVRQDQLARIRANTNVAGLQFDKIPANSPRAGLRKPGQVSVPTFDAFKVKPPAAPGIVGSKFKS